MPQFWKRDPAALVLLDRSGGPFETAQYREALHGIHRGWRDLSVGGRAPDGTCAAIALVQRRGIAESVPYGYGGVRADRDLTADEVATFLEFAREECGAAGLRVRTIGGTGAWGTTRVVQLTAEKHPETGYSSTVRRYLRRSAREGCEVHRSTNGTPFLALYREAADRYDSRYPSDLLQALLGRGCAEVFEVVLHGDVIAAAFALKGADHWLYWLGAQNDVGRAHHGGYLSVASLIETAWQEGVAWVNLGASRSGDRDLGGVDYFKQRLGGVEVDVGQVELLAGSGRALVALERLARGGISLVRRIPRARTASTTGRGDEPAEQR